MFKERVIEIIKAIPKGRVMTYGQIAAIAGSPRAARQVVSIMKKTDVELPWHRVINSKGQVSEFEGRSMQKELLIHEGIKFKGNRIDLKVYIFIPNN